MHTRLFDSAQRTRLAIAWCAWALATTGLVLLFDLAAQSYVGLLLIAEVMLARRTYHAVGSRYFLALTALPAVPLLVMALPAHFGGDALRLMALVIPPLVAAGAIAVLTSGDVRAMRGGRRIVMLAVIGGVALGARGLWRWRTAPALDTPPGRAMVAGCYRVQRGFALPFWMSREWPPRAARFDTARWVPPEQRDPPQRRDWGSHLGGPYWGEAMIQSPNGTPGWWRPVGPRSISVNWTHRGLGGFRGVFRLVGADLVGSGQWFQDMMFPIPLPPRLLAVRMLRVDCADPR